MPKFLPIMLLSTVQKVTYHYAKYYAHNFCDYTTAHIELLLFLITRLA